MMEEEEGRPMNEISSNSTFKACWLIASGKSIVAWVMPSKLKVLVGWALKTPAGDLHRQQILG